MSDRDNSTTDNETALAAFVRAERVLGRVHSIASVACNELQGRLVDEGHRKAFMALTLIVREIQNG